MNMMKTKNKVMRNEGGFATADFLFSFLLASMLTALLFAMCFTFTVIEISQYISYSSTRAGVPAHKTPSHQKQRVEAKLNRLLADPQFSPLIRNGWFELVLKDMRLGHSSSDFYQSEYGMEPVGPGFYIPAAGVRLTLTAKILNLNLGPLGKIESENGGDFNLTIGSMLFREPSQEECSGIIKERYQKLITLDPLYGTVTGQQIQNYTSMEDNGC